MQKYSIQKKILNKYMALLIILHLKFLSKIMIKNEIFGVQVLYYLLCYLDNLLLTEILSNKYYPMYNKENTIFKVILLDHNWRIVSKNAKDLIKKML